jgi:amidase
MARWVEDIILTLPLLAGPDPRDESIVDTPIGDPSAVELKSLRVAYFTTGATSEVANVTKAAAQALTDFGLSVRERRPSVFLQGSSLWGDLYWPGGGDDFRRLLALAGTKESQVSGLLSSQLSNPRISDAVYQSSLSRWETYKMAMLAFMDNFDVILTPPSPTPAVTHAQDPDYSFLTDFNVAGWPAVVVRCGTSSHGLPIGVQIIAKPWREDIVLAVAKFLETAMGGWKPVPQPTLGLLRQPAELRVTWKGYGTLQSAPSLDGPWNDDPSAKSPYTATFADTTARFFRVLQ